ncbi:PAAR domain-containing protein [Limimaricola variabilis]
MPAVSRIGDMGSGHGAFPPRASTGGSGTVFANGIGVHRQGDAWPVHCNSDGSCHPGVLASGSGTVYANGKALGRVGDPVDCGSTIAVGSGDVFAG